MFRFQRSRGVLSRLSLVVAVGFVLACAAGRVHAEPILSTSSQGGAAAGPASSWGWKFETGSSPVTVVALDAIFFFDSSTQVRLYDSSGTTLRSATVTTADPTETAGLTWHTHPIAPITLDPNTIYFIAQDEAETNILTTTPILSDGVQYLGGVLAFTTGLNPTTDAEGGSFNPAYFGPNFDPAPTIAAIPEPSTLVLLGTSLGGLMGGAWWRRRTRAA